MSSATASRQPGQCAPTPAPIALHDSDAFTKLAEKYHITYGNPPWLDDVVTRYGLNSANPLTPRLTADEFPRAAAVVAEDYDPRHQTTEEGVFMARPGLDCEIIGKDPDKLRSYFSELFD